MKQTYLLLLLVFLFACGSEVKEETKTEDKEKEEVAIPKDKSSIAPVVDVNRIVHNKKTEEIESFFERMERLDELNGSILIADKGEIIYKKTKGYANLETKDTLTENSVFQLADVSNQFTAVAIMYLKEEGRLKFTDSVQKYIPAFPYWAITIKQLLTHRSGLPNYQSICDKYTDQTTPVSNRDLFNIIIKNKPEVHYKPDTKFVYNNTGYAILTILIEEISGIKFEDFMRRRIFIPLGMKNTFIYSTNSSIPKGVKKTVGHNSRGEQMEAEYLDGLVGNKNVYTTINDLFIWDRALCEAKIIGQTTLDEAYSSSMNDLAGEKSYGYGWRIKTIDKQHKQIYSNGNLKGNFAMYIRLPYRESCIIILSNKRSKNVFRSYPRILKILDPEVFD